MKPEERIHIAPLILEPIIADSTPLGPAADEKSREQSKGEAERILACLNEGVCRFDPAGKLFFINQAGEAILVRSVAAFVGRSFHESFEHCDSEGEPYPEWACPVCVPDKDGNKNESAEVIFCRRKEMAFPLELVSRLISDGHGTSGRIIVFLDISERRSMERAISHRETLFRATFNQSAVAMAILDLQGRWLEMNEVYLRLFGYSTEEFRQMSFLDITHPEDRAEDREHMRRLISGEVQTVFREKRYIDNSGKIVWGLAHVSLVRDSLGKPGFFSVAVEDISFRKQVEAELRYKSSVLKTVTDNAGSALILLDEKGYATYANPAAERISGYTLEELKAEPAHLLLRSSEEGEAFVEVAVIHRRGKARSPLDNEEHFFRRKDGSVFPVSFSVAPLEREGKTVGAVLEFRDISGEKRAQENLRQHARQLAQSNAELSQFAYVASHDLKEPIRMVKAYVQLLEKKLESHLDARTREYMSYVVEGASRMNDLIDAILDYSAVGREQEPAKVVDCNKVVQSVLSTLEGALAEKQGTVFFDSLPMVRGNGAQLSQLFQNLISNSLKFCSSRNPQVRIAATAYQGGFTFVVEDNGIGIAPEHREKIFGMFQRLHQRHEYPGMGVGLTICRKIVERHGGQIWVEDSSLGGARFVFTLPAGKSLDVKPSAPSLRT